MAFAALELGCLAFCGRSVSQARHLLRKIGSPEILQAVETVQAPIESAMHGESSFGCVPLWDGPAKRASETFRPPLNPFGSGVCKMP